MSRWTLVIPEETDRMVRTHLARNGGKKGDLSKFVDRAVRQAVFHETTLQIKERNSEADQEEIMTLVDEAVGWTRENRP